MDISSLNNIKTCLEIHQTLLTTYHDDFHECDSKINAGLLNILLLYVAEQLGNKFVYSRPGSVKKIGQDQECIGKTGSGKSMYEGSAFSR